MISSAVPSRDDVAAVLAGARAHVDDVVGRAHRALVVLDDEHGVAEVAQALERARSAARCRAGAGRSTARRGCRARRPARSRSASPAGSAAPRRPTASPPRGPSTGSRRRRCRGSAAARRSRAGSAGRSRGRCRRARARRATSIARCADRRVNSWIGRSPTLHRARLGPQPRALALRARAHRHVLLDVLARVVGVRLPVAALEVRDDALEGGHVGARAAHPVAVGDVDLVAVGAVEEQVALVLGQLLPRASRGRSRSARRSPAMIWS